MKAIQNAIRFDKTIGQAHIQTADLLVRDERTLTQQKEQNVVGLYPAYSYQTFDGYGCAMTESACFLLSKMSPEARREALSCWFGPGGMDARFIRIPMDSCDYSLSEYQAVPDPIKDPDLKTFSIERDKMYILPIVKEAMELAGHPLSVLLSPWSPPAVWKTPPLLTENDVAIYGGQDQKVEMGKPSRIFGGSLKPEFYPSWAKYLVKYVQAYLDEGINITMLSVQNEASAATSWDSCVWTAKQEKTFLRDYLYPAMKNAGLLDRVGLFIWDHNKERIVERIDEMMDSETSGMITGFAYHWYSGDHFEALSMLHERYPDKVLLHSESCGLHIPGKVLAFDVPTSQLRELGPEHPMAQALEKSPHEVDLEDAINYAHDILGDLNHGMERWIDWNLIVDRTGGPRHVPGGFAAPLVYEEDGRFTRTVSYEYLRLIAHTLRPGSIRIGSSVFGRDIDVAAVRNKDGSLGVILLNHSKQEMVINLRVEGMLVEAVVSGETLAGILIS
ncbi:MAG: glycoside hydrolase [Clostridiales bacterium]|jgi:glucosylceramidase|nr:glycoside hydrolase [Clostridiales bacterium]